MANRAWPPILFAKPGLTVPMPTSSNATDVISPRAEQHRIRVHVRVITGLLVRAIPREDLIERDVRRADWREQEERDDDVHGGVAPRAFGFETSIS